MNLDKVFFNPWVGKKYADKNNFFKHKVMVLGESHYCGNEECKICIKNDDSYCKDFTNRVVQLYLNGKRDEWARTYNKYEEALAGRRLSLEEAPILWDSILFYNYIQRAMRDRKERPQDKDPNNDYTKSFPAFQQVIDKYKPDIIFAWGAGKLYYAMPDTNWVQGDDINISDNDRVSYVHNGYYKISNGKEVRIVFTWHPASQRGFIPSFWHSVIKAEIEALK